MHAELKDLDQCMQDQKDLIEYAKNPKGFLLLAGTNGTGKSFAAEAIYNANTHYRLPYFDHDVAYFLNLAELNQMYLNKIFDSDGLRQELKKTKLLVLDDLCANKIQISHAFSSFLYSVIDFRWLQKDNLGTIVTTNLNSEDMQDFLGTAFTSRVASGIIKRWDGPDRRLKYEF